MRTGRIYQSEKTTFNPGPRKLVNSIPSRGSSTGFSEEVFSGEGKCKAATYQYQLLYLRAALNDKELQLGELRSQYHTLINGSSEARKHWENSIRAKDLTIRQLQRALEDRDTALKRQEKLIGDRKQRLVFQKTSERVHIEQKDHEIDLLKDNNVQQAKKLEEQGKLIVELNSQHEKRENEIVAYTKQLKRKVEDLYDQLQNLEGSLQRKEEELHAKEKCFNDIKVIVWKKDCMLAQLRLAEEELQSDLERKTEAYETLKNANHKLQEDNFRMAKSLEVLKRELKTCEDALLHEFKLKEDTEFQVSCMQKQWHRLLNLERALNQKESSLHSKSIEIKAAHQANEMLAREYDYLQQEYQSLSQDHIELQIRLMGLEKQISLVEKPPKCDRSFQQAEILNSDIIQPKCLTQGRSIRTRTEDPSLPFKSIVAGCSTHHEDRTKRTQLKEPGLNGVLPSSVYPSCSTRARSSIASTADENGKASHQHVDRAFTSNLVKKSDAIPNLSSDPLKTWPEASSVAENHLHVIDTEQDTRNTNQFKQPSCLAARMPNICSEVYETNVGHDTNSASYDDFLEAKVNSKDKGDDVKSSASLELQKIQEEIQNREKSWKQTEAKMRAELSRRMSQLHEAEQEYQPFCAKESLPTRSFLRRNATKR